MPGKPGIGRLYRFDPNDLIVIGLDTKDGPEHELWDERIKLPLEEPMVVNIMSLGVKETVTVRQGEKGYEVVNGRRRVLHAREANKRLKSQGEPLVKVPATVEVGDDVHMEKLTISLNEIRRDDDTLVKAEKCMRLLHRNGGDYKDAARVFGVSVAAIKNWSKLAELAPKVKRAVAAGEISASAAAELHGVSKDSQVAKLDKLMSSAKAGGGKKATVTRVKKAAGRRVAVPKRVLLKLVDDEDLSTALHAEMISGIKLALGVFTPPETTKLGKVLMQAGFKYD